MTRLKPISTQDILKKMVGIIMKPGNRLTTVAIHKTTHPKLARHAKFFFKEITTREILTHDLVPDVAIYESTNCNDLIEFVTIFNPLNLGVKLLVRILPVRYVSRKVINQLNGVVETDGWDYFILQTPKQFIINERFLFKNNIIENGLGKLVR